MIEQEYQVAFNGKTYTQKHGSPFDRGCADSYYHRLSRPHYWPLGTGRGERVDAPDMTPDQIEAYLAGYEFNEQSGDKKDYGDY